MLLGLSVALIAVVRAMPPMLFMDPGSDLVDPWGLLIPAPNALSRSPTMVSPPANYTAGATVFAAFTADGPGAPTYEVFVAIGRPGEPIVRQGSKEGDAAGVSVLRWTTEDFVHWAPSPMEVLFLPNGAPGDVNAPRDGNIWTVKSMDRNTTHYLLFAYYGDSAATFVSPRALTTHSFKPTLAGGNFKDHDDTNLIYSRTEGHWVDMQIFSAPWLLANGSSTVCPHNLSDNGGCEGGPRVVTARTSVDGIVWTGDYGCANPARDAPFNPQKRSECIEFNESGLIRPSRTEDPPELQFYRIRPFYVGDSGRLAAHTLQYAASPAEVNNVSNYGYWGPYCPSPDGSGFIMCHKGKGYGRMHGPHIMEEWWVSSSSQTGPEDFSGWQRPFKRFRAVTENVWLMSQPVVYNEQHVWVADTGVFSVPEYRIAGISAPANGEFSTKPFPFTSQSLWLNVDASWGGDLVTQGCDEGCAAYVMVEMQYANDSTLVPGFERGNCMLLNITGQQVPLRWTGNPQPPPNGTKIMLRFYFRDATIYALGSNPQ